MDFGIFYEIQVNSPLKHREREAQAFYDTLDQVVKAEEADFEREAKGEFCPNRRLLAFDVAPDGTLGDHRVFIDMSSAEEGVPDGMKVDTQGRVFATGSGGIWVVSPEGEKLGVIRVPEGPRNVAFGGPDFRTLFITAGASLYSARVKEPGIGAF